MASQWLESGVFVDSDHPGVRDGFRYDSYRIDRSEAGFRASWVLEHGRGFCVNKATLL